MKDHLLKEHGSPTMIAEHGITQMEMPHMVLDHGSMMLELAKELSLMIVLTIQSRLITPHLMKLKQTLSTLPPLLVKIVDTLITLDTGSSVLKA